MIDDTVKVTQKRLRRGHHRVIVSSEAMFKTLKRSRSIDSPAGTEVNSLRLLLDVLAVQNACGALRRETLRYPRVFAQLSKLYFIQLFLSQKIYFFVTEVRKLHVLFGTVMCAVHVATTESFGGFVIGCRPLH